MDSSEDSIEKALSEKSEDDTYQNIRKELTDAKPEEKPEVKEAKPKRKPKDRNTIMKEIKEEKYKIAPKPGKPHRYSHIDLF